VKEVAVDTTADAEFTEFMLGTWPRLARLGYALTGDRSLGEDLAQTALAKAYASWPKVARAGDPEAYVRKIVVNACRDGFRRRHVAEVLTGSLPEVMTGDTASFEQRPALFAALMKLPAGQRAVVVLRFCPDLAAAQVSEGHGPRRRPRRTKRPDRARHHRRQALADHPEPAGQEPVRQDIR
jgi:DNA-directed RNA polymerase specialized sigma24 family protein